MSIFNSFDDLPDGIIPRQKLKSSKKNEDWWKSCVNGIIKLSSDTNQVGRSSRKDKLENYDLMNSKIKQENFLSITDRYGNKENSAMPVQMFNIVRSKVERLKGEEMQRRFGFQVVGIDGEVVQIRTDERKKLIREYLQQQLQAAIGQPQVDQQGNPIPQPELERVIKDFDKNWEDIREKWVNKILHYLKRRESLELKFNEGWEHALVGSEEIYRIGILKGEPHVRVVNPINVWFEITPHMNKIQDAEYLVERRIMSKSEILDEFEEYLSEKELSLIDSDDYNSLLNTIKFPNKNAGLFSAGRPQGDTGYELEAILNSGWEDDPYINSYTFKRGQFAVYSCVWKSWKKIGWLTYTDENGEEQTTQVDDTFKLEDDFEQYLNGSVEWSWIIETWEGHKIPGLNLYFGGQPIENQVDGELPYVGRIYNGTNTQPVSLVGLIKDYQHIHSMVWHKIKEEVAKAKGKKVKMDVAQIPKSQGMTIDTILHYFDKVDVMFYNSMEEGREGDPNSVARANQSDSFDMGISSTFTALMQVLKEIEYGVDSITGISKQREGDIAASETATNAGRAIVQSTYITESLFYTHNQCKIEVLTHLVEVAQMAYKNGKSGQFIMDDGIRAILDIDGDLLNDSKFKLFISGSPADTQVLESIKGLAQIAIQSDKANLSELIKLYKATSISEAETEIIAGEQDKIARDQAAAENQNNTILQQQAMVNQAAKDTRDWESVQKQLDRENRLQVAQTAQLGLSDLDNDGTADIFELSKIQQKDAQEKRKIDFEREKLAQEKIISDRDAKLKEKEIAVKKIAANKKPSSKK